MKLVNRRKLFILLVVCQNSLMWGGYCQSSQDIIHAARRPLIALGLGVTTLYSPLLGGSLLYPASLFWDNETDRRGISRVTEVSQDMQNFGNSWRSFWVPSRIRAGLREQRPEDCLNCFYQNRYTQNGWSVHDAQVLAAIRQNIHDRMGIELQTLKAIQNIALPISILSAGGLILRYALKDISLVKLATPMSLTAN